MCLFESRVNVKKESFSKAEAEAEEEAALCGCRVVPITHTSTFTYIDHHHVFQVIHTHAAALCNEEDFSFYIYATSTMFQTL